MNANNPSTRAVDRSRRGNEADLPHPSRSDNPPSHDGGYKQSRRRFLKKTAAASAAVAAMPLIGRPARAAAGAAGIGIVLDAEDAVAKTPTARYAAEELREALKGRGVPAQIFESLEQVPAGQQCVVAGGRTSALARQVLEAAKLTVADAPEALGIVRGRIGRRPVTLACGADARGLSYALLELADRATLCKEPAAALFGGENVVERPANRIRSAMRLFVSDVEDKGWFNDKDFWRGYLRMLATQRFNRVNLALGIGYDFATGITECYFHFAYPFLVSVPGYDVKASPLPDEERAANLEMLKFISDEATLRGLHFQLGVWTHAYKWINSPRAEYVIQGLTDETQGPYSRDALRTVLEACPNIKGVTFRIHGESGVPEGSYGFWKTVFDGMVQTKRPLELDMHAKGMDQETIDVALGTGLPVTISPKFWGEHMGLPYMQSAIRQLEMPPRNAPQSGLFTRSSGSRSFMRYSYGDLLAEGKKYQVLHRIWPGTQRLLLWGDPAMAAAQGKLWSFCGSDGVELMEPLSFKGRRGSGLPGGRDAYADATLKTSGGAMKYSYSYRLWGRLAYNPAAAPETWRRQLENQFGPGASAVEDGLANSSRILPLVTSAYAPSAGNNTYWPEMYLNMPIVKDAPRGLYGDSPAPRRFGTVSTFDPQLFAGVDEYASELLKGTRSGKYSPPEVASWTEHWSQIAASKLVEADKKVADRNSADYRRLSADLTIQCGLGKFFAWKFRTGVLYALFSQSGNRPALEQALAAYRKARAAWAELAERATGVYVADVTFGPAEVLRGHWSARLKAIDDDLADMQKKLDELQSTQPSTIDVKTVDKAIAAVMSPVKRPIAAPGKSAAAGTFRRGHAVIIETSETNAHLDAMRLHYRHVNQAENWQMAEMKQESGKWSAAIPAEYTDSAFPLQYYFELRDNSGSAWLHPGLGENLLNQPYYVLRQSS